MTEKIGYSEENSYKAINSYHPAKKRDYQDICITFLLFAATTLPDVHRFGQQAEGFIYLRTDGFLLVACSVYRFLVGTAAIDYNNPRLAYILFRVKFRNDLI